MTKNPSPTKTGILVLPDKQFFYGMGLGTTGANVGEVCFNTALTGYQEIISDPSYAGQIITFTFPHIGNVGVNDDDDETANPDLKTATRGVLLREPPSPSSNWRASSNIDTWLNKQNIIGIAGLDTRALTHYIRDKGMFHATIAHNKQGDFDIDTLALMAQKFEGLAGSELAQKVTTQKNYKWHAGRWSWEKGFATNTQSQTQKQNQNQTTKKPLVVAYDFGMKKNILRCLIDAGLDVSVVKADTKPQYVLDSPIKADGFFLSNGPGDPAATGTYAIPIIQELIKSTKPIFGICLGHQMLALALGAKTIKMKQGHHGANHPVQELETGKVEIVSMNHGFAVARDSLPANIKETHISLFDKTNCGLRVKDKPIFSVQHHPEASPGPQDSFYLFERFRDMINSQKRGL